ncbi:MAG: phenylalanine--tRNA ligase subunit beta [Phycisphaerales bacterium]|nr:phenylalanine--tRNA ligase subunit beta [Phycisphaerales bacterium]
MDISLKWLNQYLSPADVTADEADAILTEAGMPIEEHKQGVDGDTVIDVEVTSNRGDCLGHVGIAREIAAARYGNTPRTLVMPAVSDPKTGEPIGKYLKLDNRVPDLCPLFTARVITGVKVGPSPDWLRGAIESLGQKSINNVVDVTNFITLELGNPCHVFDYDKLAAGSLVVRHAEKGERVKTLYAGEHELRTTDLVVADSERPQSLAGIIGGYDSQVDDGTTTVVFEMATWDVRAIRDTGRRLQIRTDAAYRFERGIDPRSIDYAARRAVQLLCEVSGGTLCEGVLSQGGAMPEDRVIELRPSRCDLVLGVHTEPAAIVELLCALSFPSELVGEDLIKSIVPPHRSTDVTREIDLIEEVARARSLAVVPMKGTLPVTAKPPQESERAMESVASVMTAMGFFETITYSFTSPELGAMFCPENIELVAVDDNRRKSEPTLRPSVLLGLLRCRAGNQHARTMVDGGIRLFEIASTFGQKKGTRDSVEHQQLAMLMDVDFAGKKPKHEDTQHAIRVMRGVIDAIVNATFGGARVLVTPASSSHKGFDADAHAVIAVEKGGHKTTIGSFGLISDGAMKSMDIERPVVGCELAVDALVGAYPPRSNAQLLPQFPGIERDLSLIVDESVRWDQVEGVIDACGLDRAVGHSMVGVFRGEQIGAGKKSVTLRVGFRDDGRTLRHEEVDPQMEQLAAKAKTELGAEIRS